MQPDDDAIGFELRPRNVDLHLLDHASTESKWKAKVVKGILAKLDAAISMAGQGSFTIPASWVGDDGTWTNTR